MRSNHPGILSQDDIIDEHFGMITSSQAAMISEGRMPGHVRQRDAINAAGLYAFIKVNRQRQPENQERHFIVDVEDVVYRVFNPVPYGQGRPGKERRTVVIGSEPSTFNITLFDKFSEYVDIGKIERGDTVLIRNLSLDISRDSLYTSPSTSISRIKPSSSGITDLSLIKEAGRNIDVIGRVTELGPIRYVAKLSGQGQVAVADCKLSDSGTTLSASLWGSSALQTAKISINDYVKIEFCSAVERNGSVEIYANDLSRVLPSPALSGRSV
ncbi:MAG: hypothetical protein M1164_02955 [Candidatus Marsarchaeota archaeon]|jgi:hypothetical protein|nr:hypothetical protein [Candidatus Marsarchaeota archaeon]